MRNNPTIVQKYGGACLETPAKIRAIAAVSPIYTGVVTAS
jgi:hypothetical protein